jgi:uncharacterized SAM-dependent methyltransferase
LLYDALGSALFDAITLLPEYGLARADLRLLERNAKEIREYGRPSLVVELGSGEARARGILDALAQRHPIRYCPVDISPEAFREGLRSALRLRREGESALVLCLGSSIGNLMPHEAAEFFAKIRNRLGRGDLFLFSADLEKDEPRMLAAYDDALGVTAAFNLNVLVRLNREMGANFDLSLFEHVARYNSDLHRIEMHLRSRVDQVVSISGSSLLLTLRKGETIRTEYSYKFRLPEIRKLCEGAGFRLETQWVDLEWPLAQTLLRVV